MPTPTLFTEMDTLQREGDELEWKESARYTMAAWMQSSSPKSRMYQCVHVHNLSCRDITALYIYVCVCVLLPPGG